MMTKRTLSVVPYYGGKAKMAHFIAEHLNYDHTDIFVTPFGGGARCLLNKPPHTLECYNDLGTGITTLMRILSQPDTARELIHKLSDTVYSQEEFDRAKNIYNFVNQDLEKTVRKDLRYFLIEEKIALPQVVSKLLQEILEDRLTPGRNMNGTPPPALLNAFMVLFDRIENTPDFKETFEDLVNNWLVVYEQKVEDGYLDAANDMTATPYTDMEIAIATYIVFTQS